MYHPAAPTAAEQAAGFTNEDDFEFLELYNRSGSPQTLNNFYVGDGVGFTFGWYPDGTGSEAWTLESGATATWSASGLSSGSYTVYAHYSLVDGNGTRRTNLDQDAQYTITYAGGSTTVTVDQNQTNVVGNDVWVNLGVYSFNGPATVTLTRGDTDPNDWTIADTVKLTAAGQSDVIVGSPTLNSFATGSGLTTLAPGGYVVLVSDYAAFDQRYHVAANQIPVAGVYSGHLSNGGEMVRLDQIGGTYPGYIASFQIDHVNYGTEAPWPTQPDGSGPALIRIHTADYGNDPLNWEASNTGGTPGAANIPIDTSAPTIPTNLVGHITLSPATIALTWAASSDSQSYVDHYVIYRNGSAIGTSTTASYSDTGVQAVTSYSYQVSAVNRDGYESGRSTALVLAVPGIVSEDWPDNRHIEIYFSEPLNPATASVLSHYVLTGGTFSSVAISRDNTKVTLTTSAAMTTGSGYTVTMNNLTTASGNPLPASQQFSFSYAPQGTGSILREYWTNIGYGTAVSDLTSNANYPNHPSGRDLLTSFEAPVNWADAYGTRIQGYLSPPVTGYYTFWIASDDNGELWLSTNDNPANAVKIAYVTSWTGSRDWANANNPTQQSAQIYLQAGQRYYVEALQKEGGGGDNLAVRWELPGGIWENNDSTIPIPGIRLSPYGGVDATPPTAPADVQATFASRVPCVYLTWSASTDPESGVDHYVIYRDGTLLGTSTTTSYTDSSSVTAQARHYYQISAVNYDGFEGLQSLADGVITEGVASVQAADFTVVRVTFTEPMDSASAQTTANYHISGFTISSAHLETDNCTVTLTTTSSLGTTSHTLTVSNVKNRTGTTLATQSVSFALAGTISYDYWLNIGGGTAVSDLTSNANYPNNPTGEETLTSFDAPYDWADDYGGRIQGYVLPPTTGNYVFWIASDDNGELWLSTNSDPANKVEIASQPGATGHNQWNAFAQQQSVSIYLVAGQKYYIEALQKEGGGGDNLSVAWQLPGTTFNTSSGLPIAGQYLAAYSPAIFTPVSFTVGVNPLITNDTAPALSGAVSDPNVTVTVRVAGTYYPAINNGDGTWTLSKGEIVSPLAAGTYDVLAIAVDASGNAAFDPTVGDLVIDTTTPTVSITAVTPNLRVSPVASIAIQFSEPVAGFNLGDLQFTLSGVSLPLNAATLTTTDQQHWTLGNLAGITSSAGSYQLTLIVAGSGIADLAGNPLLVGASTSWQTVPPIPGDFNLDGVVDNLDEAIWFANAWTGTTWAQGDANGDGHVDGLDRDIVLANMGESIYTENADDSPQDPTPPPAPTDPDPISDGGPLDPAPAQPEPLAPVVPDPVPAAPLAPVTPSVVTPSISAIVVAEASTPKNGVLDSNDSLKITWSATSPNRIASQTMQIDGTLVKQINGPYGGTYYSCPIGKHGTGSHSYTITTTDAKGVSSTSSGTFTVLAPPPPTIAGVVVAEAGTTKNGVLESNETIKITWMARSQSGIASQTMQVDGTLIKPINGPYGGLYYSCPIGIWSAGSHSYTITATDTKGVSSNSTGTFSVAAAANSGPTIGQVVVSQAKGRITWNAADTDGVKSCTLKIDGTLESNVGGPYIAASGVNFSATLGSLAAGNHTYTITATDRAGNVSSFSGSFTLSASSSAAKNALFSVASLSALSNSAKLDWVYDLGGLLSSGPSSSDKNNSSADAVDAVLAAY